MVIAFSVSMMVIGIGCKDNASGKTAGAATEEAALPGEGMRIVFVSHDLNPFFATVLVGIKDYAELVGWDATMIGPAQHDVAGTIETQHSVIASKPDAVAFTAVDSESFNETIKKAQDAGIFVILFNTRAPGVKEATGVAYVGQDFLSAGHVAGYEICKYVEKHTGRKDGKIVMSNFAPGHFALETRNLGGSQGIEMYNEEFGTNFTSEDLATSADEVEAIAKFEAKWLAESDEIVGWLSSEFTHGFIANWSKKEGLVGKFAVGGYDTLDSVMIGIEDGSVDFTLGQNPYGQGFITSALMWQGAIAKQPAGDVDTGAELIDASNIAEVMEREAIWVERGEALGLIK
jgi:ribose transport system substrate-binding protein